MTSKTLTGYDAITYAAKTGRPLNKYADPTEGARSWLTVDDAREIAREDPGLIWIETEATSVAKALRAIPSETRSQASRENGKRGGRPRKKLETPCAKDHSGNHEMVYGGKMSGRPYYQCSGCGEIRVIG